MVMAAVDGKTGSPGQYRDYKLRQIMDLDSMKHVEPVSSEAVVRSPAL
jgi:hypothetical protein